MSECFYIYIFFVCEVWSHASSHSSSSSLKRRVFIMLRRCRRDVLIPVGCCLNILYRNVLGSTLAESGIRQVLSDLRGCAILSVSIQTKPFLKKNTQTTKKKKSLNIYHWYISVPQLCLQIIPAAKDDCPTYWAMLWERTYCQMKNKSLTGAEKTKKTLWLFWMYSWCIINLWIFC